MTAPGRSRVHKTVTSKLTLIMAACLAVFFGGATWLNLVIQERGELRILRLNGAQLADMVAAATQEAMLHNDRARIQRTVDTIAEQRGIERVRVIEKGGRVAYSTDHAEIGSQIDINESQCMICHRDDPPPLEIAVAERAALFDRPGGRVLGTTRVILNQAECSNAGCHFHKPSDSLLGVLDVNLSLDDFDQSRRRSARDFLIVSLVGLVLILTINVFVVRRIVHRPVQSLIRKTAELGDGNLSARVPESSNDELSILAGTFNRMASDLGSARSELIEWGRTLEQRVEEKSRELTLAQEQMIQVERMASLGKLAAVVAHEINNPLSSVVTYAKLLVRRLRNDPELSDDCKENLEYLESIASEATRCGEIVTQLLSFARKRGGEFSNVNINQVIERSIFLVKHKMQLAEVDVEIELSDDIPTIFADPNQLQQALMAILINACEALVRGGVVRIETTPSAGGATITISDNGPGMETEVAQRIFEPFYTTKDEASGVGLGLAVVYGIVERHKGSIEVDTHPGRGCRFEIFLPLDPGKGGAS